MIDNYSEDTKDRIKHYLEKLDREIVQELSLNITISLYDIIGEFYSDEQKFELKLANFFAGMPDKLKLLQRMIGDISTIRREIMKGGEKTIVPPNKAIYERDDDSVLVENLLKARGFIMLPKIHEEVQHEVVIKEAMGCN